MIAKLAYLTTPAPGRYILKFQPEGEEGIQELELSRAHLANLIVDGASVALREHQYLNRVPETPPTESANERAGPQ